MTPEIRQKLAKIYELVKRGTDGEQVAAQAALDRMLDKYKLHDVNLEALDVQQYTFTYVSDLEHWLMGRISFMLVGGGVSSPAGFRVGRKIKMMLTYVDYVTVSCAYEYFRRHMKAQWKKIAEPVIKKHKSVKTRKRRRKELLPLFFDRYCIESGLYQSSELKLTPITSKKERANAQLLSDVEGGQYNRQVVGGLMLN